MSLASNELSPAEHGASAEVRVCIVLGTARFVKRRAGDFRDWTTNSQLDPLLTDIDHEVLPIGSMR